MSNDTVFWIFDPCVLFKTEFTLIFNKEMSLEEKANAATRIFLVIILIMFLLRVKNLYLYFFIGLIIIITVYLIRYNTSNVQKTFLVPVLPTSTLITCQRHSMYRHLSAAIGSMNPSPSSTRLTKSKIGNSQHLSSTRASTKVVTGFA